MATKREHISIVDAGMTVEGEISCKGKLFIKGTLKGALVADTVVIGQEGAIFADTKAINVTIGGSFEGSVRALNDLIILSTGKCSGKVFCKNLVVEPGGILNAGVTRIEAQEVDAVPPASKK